MCECRKDGRKVEIVSCAVYLGIWVHSFVPQLLLSGRQPLRQPTIVHACLFYNVHLLYDASPNLHQWFPKDAWPQALPVHVLIIYLHRYRSSPRNFRVIWPVVVSIH